MFSNVYRFFSLRGLKKHRIETTKDISWNKYESKRNTISKTNKKVQTVKISHHCNIEKKKSNNALSLTDFIMKDLRMV